PAREQRDRCAGPVRGARPCRRPESTGPARTGGSRAPGRAAPAPHRRPPTARGDLRTDAGRHAAAGAGPFSLAAPSGPRGGGRCTRAPAGFSWRGFAAGARAPAMSWQRWFVAGVRVLAALGAAAPLRRLDERRRELSRTGRFDGPAPKRPNMVAAAMQL